MHTRSRERGGMLVLAGGIILILTGFAALALDIGRIYLVRSELQNVADSAALAGANCLPRQSDPGTSTDCIAAVSTGLNWARAGAKAVDQLSRNAADGAAISSTGTGHTVELGYWNLLTQSPTGGSFSTTASPLTNNDRPAVRVQVRKAAGVNNGPVTMLTRLIFGGGADVALAADAVAVISSPSTVLPGSVIPQAINQCMFDRFWDSTTNSPKIYTGTPPDPYGLSTVGQPWTVRIGSSYHYDTCESGQWTTFNLDTNSNAVVKDLIANGNPTTLNIGDPTWIKPGTATSSYHELDRKYPTPPGADVSVLVVDSEDLSAHHGNDPGFQAPVIAFAGFRIQQIGTASQFYIQGQFIPSSITTGSSGAGPFYGTFTPPRLGR